MSLIHHNCMFGVGTMFRRKLMKKIIVWLFVSIMLVSVAQAAVICWHENAYISDTWEYYVQEDRGHKYVIVETTYCPDCEMESDEIVFADFEGCDYQRYRHYHDDKRSVHVSLFYCVKCGATTSSEIECNGPPCEITVANILPELVDQ